MKKYLLFFLFLTSFAFGQNTDELTRSGDDKYGKHEYASAIEFYIKAFAKDSTNNGAAYNIACCYSLLGDKQNAYTWLEKALKAGWKDINHVLYDEDLNSIKNDLAWHCIMAPNFENSSITLESRDKKMFFAYEAARSYANCGDTQKVIINLDRAMDMGWIGINEEKTSKDFEHFRKTKQWRILEDKFREQNVIGNRNFISGMYMGILFILFFYNLFLYVSMKDISFLYYALMIFSYSQIEAIRTQEFGFYARDIFIWYPYFSFIGKPFYFFISAAMLLHVLFARSFLNVKNNNPHLNKWMIGFIVYFILQTLVSLTTAANTRPYVYFSAMLIYVSTFIFGIVCWRKGYRPARFFVIASFSSTLGLVLSIMRSLGFIDQNIRFGVFGTDTIGVVIFFALLSFALGDKIKILKLEKESAQEKALEVLEEKVVERTKEIVSQKHIIEEKQKEIIDSIRYARRIQSSLLPTERYIDKVLGKKD
jgi:hypothetical protein